MKILKAFIAIILCLSLLNIWGCSSNSKKELPLETLKSSNTNISKEKIRIGLSLPSQQEDRWIVDLKNIQEECDKLNIDLLYEYADMDSERQEIQCLSMIAKGIKLLILIPYDANKTANIVNEAHAKNIKVISYDRLAMDSDIDLYISFDNESVGKLMGKLITSKVPKGNYVFLSGAANDRNSYYLKSGSMSYVKPLVDKGDIKIVMEESVTDWDPNNAYKLLLKALKATNGNIQAIIAPNDGTASGCIKALSDFNLAGKIPVTGQDAEISAARRINEGTQFMTVFKDIRLLSKKSVSVAMDMINNKNLNISTTIKNDIKDVPSIFIPPVAVTKENLEEILVNSGYMDKEEIYSE